MADIDSMPSLTLSIFMVLRLFDSKWNERLGNLFDENWKLDVVEGLALIMADNDPLTSQADLGHRLCVHPNVMVALVRRLRRKRLIVASEHPRDGRKQIITLTAKGRQIVREIKMRNQEILDRILPLAAVDRRKLEELIGIVINENGHNLDVEETTRVTEKRSTT